MAVLAEVLSPAIQQYVVEAAGYIAGIDEMIAANMRLAESIRVTAEQARAMGGQAAGGAEAGAVGAAGGADAAAAAAGQTELADAERMAAEAARVEQETLQMLAETERRAAEASKAVTDGMRAEAAAMKTARDAAAALKTEEVAVAETSAKAAEGSRLLGVQAALSGKKVSELKSENGNLMASLNKVGGATILAAGAFAGYGMKAAADFQQQILRLKTSAGNTGDFLNGKFTGDLKVASDGILKMSVDTGTSAKELAQGMYVVQSANLKMHGATIGAADALKILRAAAEGAKIEGADTSTVVNALTTVMNDYHLSVDKAVPAMNALIAGVASGKTNLQDLAGAMHTVMPLADSLHLSIGQVVGALATMTAHGVTAELAGQHLANMMRNLVAPNAQAAAEMQKLGLSATDLGQHLGQRGLTGTLDLLMKAITDHVDKKTGLVLADQLDKSKVAADQAKAEFQQMPEAVRKLAQAYLDGSGNVKGFGAEVSKLPLAQQQLLKAFEENSKKATGFSASLKGNKEAAQTVDAALKKLTGGAVGLESALQLTGENADGFKSAVANVDAAVQHGGAHVENWQKVQKTFNFQLDQAKQAANRVAITIGTELLPKIQAVMKWLSQHPTLVKDIAMAVGVFLAAAAAIKIMSVAMGILNLIMDANPIGLIIIALVAVVAAVLYAWNHFSGFRNFMKQTWADLKAAAEGFWHGMEAVWHGVVAAWDGIKDGVSAAVGFIRDHWRLIISIMLGPLGVVIALVTKYWHQIYSVINTVMMFIWHDVIQPAVQGIVAWWHWWWNNFKPVADSFMNAIHMIADLVMWWWHSVLEPAYKAVGDLIMWWYNSIVKPAFGLVVAAVHLLADAFMWWWHAIVEPAFHAVQAVISAVANAVVGYFKWWISNVKTVLGWFGQLAVLFYNWFMAGYNAVVSVIGKVFSFIAGIPGTVIHLLSSLYDDMLQIGKNIIVGIWNGLVSMASWLASSIEHLISNIIPGPIKSVLGISSPSKLMHGFGQNIAQGLALGMASQAGHVYAAASALAKTAAAGAGQMSALTVGVSGSYGGLSGALAASGQAGGAALGGSFAAQLVSGSSSSGGAGQVTVVHVHMEVHGSISAHRDIVRDVQQAVLQTNMRNPTNNLSLPTGR